MCRHAMRYLTALLPLLATVRSAAIPEGVTVGLRPEYYHPINSLYHSQDKSGHYVYGYATPAISQSEVRSGDGVTRGGYSYIDEHGVLQTVQYIADPVHGFRVSASNLPQEAADVAHARAAHLAQFEAIKSERAQIAASLAAHVVPYSNPVGVPASAVPQISPHQLLPQPVQDLPEVVAARNAHLAALNAAYAGHVSAALPQPVHDLPEVAKARAEHLATVDAVRSRDAALRAAAVALSPIPDELNGNVVPLQTGHGAAYDEQLPVAEPVASYAPAVAAAPSVQGWNPYTYGYVGPHSAATETQSQDGVVSGGYSYIDAKGVVQTVTYVADGAGFRVAASNLPVDNNHLRAPVAVQSAPASHSIPVASHGAAVAVEEAKVVVPASYSTEVVY